MFNKNFLLLILLLIKTILSLKPTDLCNNIQEECKGSYDHNQKYQVKCERFKCQGKYNFQCDFNKCAMSKKNCDEYNFLSYSINLEKLKSYMGRYTFINDEQVSKNENERKKLKLFYQRIENCPGIIYEWKASDICINGLHCIAQKIVPMRSGI